MNIAAVSLLLVFIISTSLASGKTIINCSTTCSNEYRPICAEIERPRRGRCTFPNRCVLARRQCRRPIEVWRIMIIGTCPIASKFCDRFMEMTP
ncbi:turripeptide Gli9.1 [Glossina fuscipes]|uniref:Turripeptide Gli9.1 n=1 Tax=Glossina fuscipes TaxID=7396 RepID=A0A9C6DN00_9MUSC|nr:turripeptide Gli9.1 [Glossina fuscipes]